MAAPTAEAVSDYIRREHLKVPVIVGHSLACTTNPVASFDHAEIWSDIGG
ncbi:hypothetical protein [Brytella acorum]|uniref:Uncharacterized protein n=1 Tax=Brytella acorum TaxID=2959299 RepID=A0AA35UKQ9_9PROT|nr:hypothetical protein [Brytella acorum]CAI9122250.1 hypothetical protein LMG32879_003110 [Brytella acorum]